MGMQAQIKGQFTASAMLTAINTKLTAASLPTVPTGDGIKPDGALLVYASAWPAIAIEGPVWQQTEWASGTERELSGEVTLRLLVSGADLPTLLGQCPDYGDAVRAAVEATVTSPIIRCECTSGSADGVPVEVEGSGIPVRLIEQTYRVTARYVKGQA